MAGALFRRLVADRFQPTDLTRSPWTRDALHGVGLAESALFDEQGPIGRSIRSLLVEARG